MTIPLRTLIASTQRLAVTKLAIAIQAADDPAEIRRLSEVILKLDPENYAETDQTPAFASPPETHPARPMPAARPVTAARPVSAPLSPAELDQLARILPHVRRERFTRKHSPDYWRDVLARHPPPGSITQAA